LTRLERPAGTPRRTIARSCTGRGLDHQAGVLKVEFHSHSGDDPVDRISYTTWQLIDRAAELGYDALAVTLHDKAIDTRRYADYAAQRGIVLISGIERTIQGKHVLLLNFSRAVERVETFGDLAALRARESGLVIAPHAFFPGSTCLGALLDKHADLFDAVEWNAMFTRTVNFNEAAFRWARAHDKPMVGNCDVHRLHQLGTTYSLVDAEPNADAICAAVRAGRVSVQATPLSFMTAASTMADMFAWHFAQKLGFAAAPREHAGTAPQRSTI
jgi:predicted metal-dependent phosphoesterase TrpH